eukprot:gnl/TRDRNA2_/TRDRNA2_174687_c0_seq11.p1 gnl/TRDRNA2_/TRDRNA2_174687_c0~~gnl/TRDRNA2_/TRDRNA2_174687_c0_seq11.p1  ORF type:complete len:198 (+),score=49.83 gnl/TRDRNA2_/TRDRNA2_174687_c0_seq11:473-1066(+)
MAKAKALQASMEELGHSAALCKQVMATQEQEQRPAPAPAGVATGKSPDREHPERPRPAKELPGSFGPSSSVQHSKDVEQADAAGAAAGCKFQDDENAQEVLGSTSLLQAKYVSRMESSELYGSSLSGSVLDGSRTSICSALLTNCSHLEADAYTRELEKLKGNLRAAIQAMAKIESHEDLSSAVNELRLHGAKEVAC